MKTKFFCHYSEPSCGLQSVVNARLPPVKLQKFRMQYKIVSLKVNFHDFQDTGMVSLLTPEY